MANSLLQFCSFFVRVGIFLSFVLFQASGIHQKWQKFNQSLKTAEKKEKLFSLNIPSTLARSPRAAHTNQTYPTLTRTAVVQMMQLTNYYYKSINNYCYKS